MEKHIKKSIPKTDTTLGGLFGYHRWRLLISTCIVLFVLPFSLVQATPNRLNQENVKLFQPDPTPVTTYLLLIVIGETATPPPPDPQAPRFDPGACPIAPPAGVEVTCGYLSVPESRQQPTEQRIQLAVLIVHATGDNPSSDPVIFLQGGPGAGAIDATRALVQVYAPILEQRDLIVLDQRGTGYSHPNLDCPYPSLNIGEQTIAERLGLIDTAEEEDPIREAVTQHISG